MDIQTRQRHLINTDPQRRCYNGCHAKSELVWSPWETLESNVPEDKIERRIEFWKELNQIAIDGRGEGARREFRIVS